MLRVVFVPIFIVKFMVLAMKNSVEKVIMKVMLRVMIFLPGLDMSISLPSFSVTLMT